MITTCQNLRLDRLQVAGAAAPFEIVETHISWVVLTGDYAYKIKKPLELGFLDFSTLEKRHLFCQEELRLNSRLAPHIYLSVVPVTGTLEQPCLEGEGPILDYAVKMRQFDQSGLLDREIAEGRVSPEQIDGIAEIAADFHSRIARAGAHSRHGLPENIQAPAIENFEETLELIGDHPARPRLARLREWTEDAFARLRPLMASRHDQGFVRECHGDMHLGNMVHLGGGELLIFDGIEFNDNLRWIDVLNEVAFLFMDLDHRGRPDYAWRALNRYLELTGDYQAVPLLDYYLVYRVMVRAKVAAIRLAQSHDPALEEEFLAFLAQAERYAASHKPRLMITHGLSGSGKTYLSQKVLERVGALRLRSDTERKRLHGLSAEQSSGSGVNQGIYTPEASRRTYEHLVSQASCILKAGHHVIVDAAFLHAQNRAPFRRLAQEIPAEFLILDLQTDPDLCRRRIQQRQQDASEADLAVLDNQLAHEHQLDPEEQAQAVAVGHDLDQAMARLTSRDQ
ncbi:MAG: AAA family ATPase [Candidatus Eremiobacteraeota bacterium]|nr:AAA family ATPase [Candidatus Eremiobacteraeota bacterium]